MSRLIWMVIIMATFSMFNARITVAGDKEVCKAHLGDANLMLYQLRNLNKTGFYALKDRAFQDGTVMTAWSADGKDYVNIYRPPEKRKKGSVIELTTWHTVFCGYGQTSNSNKWRVNKVKQDGTTKWDEYLNVTGTYYSAYKSAVDKDANVFTVGRSFKYTIDDGYFDEFGWTIEKRGKNGTQKWIIEDSSGEAIDIAVDDKALYVIGKGFGGVYNGSFVQVEKRSLGDGSLIWQKLYPKLGTYDRAVACAVDKGALYVTAYALWGSSPQYQQGRVLTIDKTTGDVESTATDTLYTSPFPRASMYEIAVAVRDPEKSGPRNVVTMTDRWIKTLDQDPAGADNFALSVTYDFVVDDFLTIDKGVAADKAGVYTVGQLPKTGSFDYHGYEVKGLDKGGEELWSVVYDDGAGYDVGPFLTDIAIDDKNVYVSGFKKESSGRKPIKQAFDKKTGEILWTQIETDVTYNYLWGIATGKTVTRIEQE